MSTISQRLDLRQSQNLVMTPQLQQAIRLLQLNNVELAEFLEEEIEKNPLLEKDERREDDAGGDSGAEAPAGTAERDGNGDDAGTPPDAAPDSLQGEFDQGWTGNESAAAGGEEPADFAAGSLSASGPGGSVSFDDDGPGFEEMLKTTPSLRDHLIDQLHIALADPRDRMIGAQLIDQLDESGYLRDDPADLAERLGCAEERIHPLLDKLKKFDPTGIFARDLGECLALQLEEQKKLDAPMRILLDNLPLLAAHDRKKLCALCGVNETYLQDMIGDIRALNPKPARDFEHFVVQTAIPDVLMKRLPKNLGGGWRVELNHDTLPKVLINQSYATEVAKSTTSQKDKDYLNQQVQSANWLVKALDQRAKTILKVASEIVEQQEGFFLYGIEFLKPLTLKNIAEAVEMHESTISRVTTNKYIGTPRGLFELKYFFTTAIGEGDNAMSAESVRTRIKGLIAAESADNVLSDDSIVDILKKDGIDLARRTVAKYRESMNIPSSVQRRRQKQAR